jgi:GTPase
VLSADLLLHVRDISHPDTDQQKQDVLTVLREIGVEENVLEERTLEIWNKIDLLPQDAQMIRAGVVPLSALTGEGITALQEAIRNRLTAAHHTLSIILPIEDGENLAWLHQHGRIVSENLTEDTRTLSVQLSDAARGMWEKRQQA